MNAIQPIATKVPYMVLPGNHEVTFSYFAFHYCPGNKVAALTSVLNRSYPVCFSVDGGAMKIGGGEWKV